MLEIRLHGALWREASPARRREWERSLEELNAGNGLEAVGLSAADEPALELVRLPDGTFQARTYRGAFDRHATVALDISGLAPLFDDYAATIRQMVHVDSDAPVRGFEALDYAKRVVHDEAAEFLARSMGAIANVPFEDARRLFTLIFLIAGDLPEELVRYHRRHL